MLKRQAATALILALAVAACGDAGSLKPKAAASVSGLHGSARAAAGALVRLERAVRAKDVRGLCARVYSKRNLETFARCAPLARGLAAKPDFALRVRSVRVTGERAVAIADVWTRTKDHVEHERQTFQLVREGRDWEILFVT